MSIVWDEEWLNVERWLEPWDDDNDVSDSERLLNMDFRLQLIDQRLRRIANVSGACAVQNVERPESSNNGGKFHRVLGPIPGEQHCEPDKGCSSTLKYFECPKCPAHQVLSREAVKLEAGCGPQLVEGFVNCRYWNLERVKTFPLKGRSPKWFELHPEVLRTRMGARVTLVVIPGVKGIDIVRGELLGSCQKLNQVRVYNRINSLRSLKKWSAFAVYKR